MPKIDPPIHAFSHLAGLPRADEALRMLKKLISHVKPIMRARHWKVGQVVEFYPDDQTLLGLNYNHGQKICLRLRFPGDHTLFLPLEQVIDTMLHELTHIVFGPHDEKFYALWNQLRDEHESLIMKGYTGENFLSEGHRLGGRTIPMDEARRLARDAAERRRAAKAGSGKRPSGAGSQLGQDVRAGQRLGGTAPRPGKDMRAVIADAASRRIRISQGCANDTQTDDDIRVIAETATRNGFKTQAEEDAANEVAIAQALWEMVEEEERVKKGDKYLPPLSTPQASSSTQNSRSRDNTMNTGRPAARPGAKQDREPSGTWSCDICTLVNPARYLCCDACGVERIDKADQGVADGSPRSAKPPQTVIDLTGSEPPGASQKPRATTARTQVPKTWVCHGCGRVVDHRWWSCNLCGTVKLKS
ncbi:WLM-domain-containing protein [Xylariaceae sp. FL0255]|nr:WLM-domain-containing protein [Xylariaceae sp. FL0255]